MNRYWVDQPTKTTPTSADIVCIRDVADSDKTKKSILSNLWTAIWGTNDSDNINEWATNLFYTTARNLLKANESEVIHNTWNESWITWTKSWTYTLSTTWNITATEFIWDWTNLTNVPVSITGQTEEPAITDWDELAFYDTTAGANRKIDYTDLKSAIASWLRSKIVSVWTLTFDDVAQSDVIITHNLGVIPKKMSFVFPGTIYGRIWEWADNNWTKTSLAYINNSWIERTVTTNEAIACWNDTNSANWEWRVSSVTTTTVTLSYTIVNDPWSWVPTTENPYVILSY